jgi:septum site-determining protein MinC
LVAAAALGLHTRLTSPGEHGTAPPEPTTPELTIHRGTLRSGDHLQVAGSVLLLGDVNPGARISAGGDVRVWGRLRGIAHAGCQGNTEARIVALQLRPLQLRIAGSVARGPEDPPPAGFCEEAVLVEGAISIRPAEPTWPAAGSGLSG